ncbi:T9SS type A sorting domain-containing protein [Flavobacteriales bacterium]|nr:T9SS type A sorting domain-containing protein [Flavobacteriales bacterium]
MRHAMFILLTAVSFSIQAQNEWVSMASFDGNGRHHPITVANDQFGYVIAGQAGFAALNLDDVFRYDPSSNSWEEMEAFPGGGRGYGYGVCEGDNAYVGFGSNNSGYPTDWWHLDMASGNWTALAEFPGLGRNHPAMVLAGGKIMVGLGSNDIGNLGDWWAYDVASDSWEQRAAFTAGNRHHPFYFGIDGAAYVGFGHGDTQNGDLTIYKDFHRYDPVSDVWTPLEDFPGEARVAGTQFAKDGFGYVLSGDGDNHGPLDYGEFWKYSPSDDSWTEMPAHPGGARWAPGSFVLGCYVYLTAGLEGVNDTFHQDLWRFSLSDACGCTDPTAVNYSGLATDDDGSCCYVSGCTQESAVNFNPEACLGDGSCIAPILGCTDASSEFFDPEANTENALGGPLSADALGAGGYHFNDMWDMVFSVSEPTTLQSVEVLAETSFPIGLYIRDASGGTVFEENYTLQAGWNTLAIDTEIPNGVGFQMGIEGTNDGLFRNSAVPSGTFPISVADRLSITGNTTDSPLDYHYYFYRWRVSASCSATNAIAEGEYNEPFAFPNPAMDVVTVQGLGAGKQVVVMDGTGRVVQRAITGETLTFIHIDQLPEGLYILAVEGEWSQRFMVRH